jgi:CheY-like chemotaxis protein
MMGGEIEVESVPGRGSTFSFTADFGLAGSPDDRRCDPPAGLAGMRVLVVDDHPTSRVILREMLESFTCEVTTAASGAAGLAEFERAEESRRYELVVMDWKMPGMDGLEAARRIKTGAARRPPAVLLVTAFGCEDIRREAEAAGLEGVLQKPVSAAQMFDTILAVLGRRPPAPSAAGAAERTVRSCERLAGRRVLLVEDNEINQQVALETLRGAGLEAALAVNGREAVARVARERFDAVLMDVQMPVMDGYAAAMEIRKWEAEGRNSESGSGKTEGGRRKESLPPIPIIAMTANAMPGDAAKSLAAGMNDHLTKPIDPDTLFATLARWITVEAGCRRAPALPAADAGGPREETVLPDGLPGFDLAQGLRRLQGNRALYRRLLVEFADRHRHEAEELRHALAAGDFDRARHRLHTVKGVAGNLAATPLAAASAALEALVRDAERRRPSGGAGLDAAYAAFKDALDLTVAAAGALAPAGGIEERLPADAASMPAPEIAAERIAALRAAAESGDVGELAALARELCARSGEGCAAGEHIRRMAEDFDAEGILNLLARLEVRTARP